MKKKLKRILKTDFYSQIPTDYAVKRRNDIS